MLKRGDMRWFRFGLGRRQVQHDPSRQQALLAEIRQGFGARVEAPFADQADGVARMLAGDDGLAVAAEMVREVADQAHAELLTQAKGQGVAVNRWNYRPLWRAAGPHLRWPLFALPGGLHPYAQISGAVLVIGGQANRVARVTDPDPLLEHVFEVLDLTIAGWEYGRVRVDTDAATLADRLIVTAREIREAMGDPPPLPPPVRELMRRNHTIDVYDPTGPQIVGAFNPGRTMRESLLV